MSPEIEFYIIIGGMVAQIMMLTAFYFVAFRRLFLNPISNVIPIVLFLIFFQLGYPITMIWGWVQSGAKPIRRFMTFWTVATALMVLGCMMQADSPSVNVISSLIATCGIAVLTMQGLVPFFILEERLRNLQHDPQPRRIADCVALGPAIIPDLQRLLHDDYQPTRLAAVECLSQMGNPAITALSTVIDDADPQVANAAREAIGRNSTVG